MLLTDTQKMTYFTLSKNILIFTLGKKKTHTVNSFSKKNKTNYSPTNSNVQFSQYARTLNYKP